MRVLLVAISLIFGLGSVAEAQWWVAPPKKSKKYKKKKTKRAKSQRVEIRDEVSRSRLARKRTRRLKKSKNFFLRVAPQAGFSVFTLGGGDANFVLDDTADEANYYKGRTGASGGVLTEINLGFRQFTMETGLSMIMAGASTGDISSLFEGSGSSEGEINIEYIGLPILAKLYFDDYRKTTFYGKAGIIPVFAMSKDVVSNDRLNGSFFTTSSTSDDLINDISDFDILFNAALGANIKINREWSATLEGQIYHGMMSVTEGEESSTFNQGIGLSLGVGYLF